jgi:hypothetical protein
MIFWFKRKKIVVDCFTAIEHVYDLYPIESANKFYPDSFKKLPNTYTTKHHESNIDLTYSTIKFCNGITELYKNGLIIPFWADFVCQPKSAKAGETSIGLISSPFQFSNHPRDEQFPGLFTDYIHVKLWSPWKIKEKTGITWHFGPTSWNSLCAPVGNFLVLNGMLQFNYQASTHVNILINNNSPNFTLYGGTPLVHLIPLTEHEVIYKNHLISLQEQDSIGIPSTYSHLTRRRLTRYTKEVQSKKCPFGFGK